MDLQEADISPTLPPVAVAILNYNGLHHLQRFLPGLLQNSYSAAHFYVIDNASTDGSVEWVTSSFPQVSVIKHAANHGFADGYNLAVQQLHEEYILVINSDVQVQPGFLKPLVEHMQRNPKIAAVQPKILALNAPQHFEHAGAAGGMIDSLAYAFCRGRVFEAVERDEGQYEHPTAVFWASGACSLYRRSAWLHAGGMYSWFFMHFEEIDLCWRLQTNGYEIWYEPKSIVHHLGGGSLAYASPGKTFYNFRNNLVMVMRNSPTPYLLWWLPLRLLLDSLAAIHFALKGQIAHAAAVLRAWWHVVKWAGAHNYDSSLRRTSLSTLTGVFHGSVLWQYFVLGKKQL